MFFILTVNLNYGCFLEDALLSVAGQANVESVHHVQDGASQDNTLSLMERYSSSRVTFESRPDSGMSDALNKGLAHVPKAANYIGWLNADEFYLPGTLSHVSAIFRSHPEIDILYGDTYCVDESGDLLRLLAQHRYSARVLKSYGAYMQTASLFLRRKILDAGDLRLDQSYRQSMDFELFLRLTDKGYRFAHIKRPLSAVRVHDGQLTNINGPDVARSEYERLVRQYGIIRKPRSALAEHRALKLLNGAYVREFACRRKIGQPLRWFQPDNA
jgi:GT2 family glycosyltransferase